MPATKRLLTDRGVTFGNHIVTTPICCPSRVNLLRGQLSHNTNFTDVLGPHGGYAKFRALGLDREWLPVWLQRAGYSTLYTGKFIVDYTIRNHDPHPAGWSAFDALVHPFTFEYYCPAFSLNGGPPKMYPAQYVTDVVGSKAVALLRSAAADPAGRPFYLQVAPPAPHHSMHYDYAPNGTLQSRHWYPPVPAARHWELFSGAGLPRPPSFNQEDMRGKPAWLQQLDRLTPGNVTFLEEVFRLRLRTLRAVDEMVEALAAELSALGLADSTYVLLTSDNGYHEGAHRMGSGKTTAFEEDLLVPLVLAGPGLLPGSRVEAPTAHIDLAPTVLALAGVPLPPSLDGTPLPLAAVSDGSLPAAYTYGRPDRGPLRSQLLAEFWGEWFDESIHSRPPYSNLTWKAVRLLRSDRQEAYKYVMHCNGEYELYDLVRDPYELTNLLAPAGPADGNATPAESAAVPNGADGGDDATGDNTRGSNSTPMGTDAARAQTPLTAAVRAWTTTAWAALAAVTRGSFASAPRARSSRGSHAAAAATGRAAADAGACPGQTQLSTSSSTGSGSVFAVTRGPAQAQIRQLRAAQSARVQGREAEGYAVWLRRLRSRLDALLAVLAVCAGDSCVRPFQVIHPDGGVLDLWTAMDERYDTLYGSIRPFSFSRCLPYQDAENERSPFRGAAAVSQANERAVSANDCSSGAGPQPAGGGPHAHPRQLAAAGAAATETRPGDIKETPCAVREGCATAAESRASVTLAEAAVTGGAAGQGRAAGERARGGSGGAGSHGVGVATDAQYPPLPLLEADVEADAVPLPRKYQLVVDVYGDSAAQDAALLA